MEEGFFFFNEEKNGFERVHTKNGETFFPEGIVRYIFENQKGALLLGTNEGVYILYSDLTSSSITTSNGLPFNIVTHLWEDENGLWIGSRGGGLSLLKEGKLFHCNTDNGLFDDVIYYMEEDATGKLWISCNKGIFTINKKEILDFYAGKVNKITSTNFDKTDGMHSVQCSGGFMPAGIKTPNGKIHIPTLKGIVCIDNERLKDNPFIPPVFFKKWVINGQAYVLNTRDTTITLESTIDKMEVSLSILSFRSPLKNKLEYVLEGLESEIYSNTKSRQLTYTNIGYGTYVLKVWGTNEDGIKNDQPATLTIHIPIPWYLSTQIKVIGFILFILTIYAFVQYRIKATKAENEKLELIVKEKTKEITKEKEVVEFQNSMLQLKNIEIETQKSYAEHVGKQLKDSIRYAKRIQDALLPSTYILKKIFPDFSSLYLPKDIISGDFFWYTSLESPNHAWKHLLIVADCTGHGVPGAFMTLISSNLLKEVVGKNDFTSPSEVLYSLDQAVIHTFSNHSESNIQDGLDLGICCFNEDFSKLSYCGAKLPLCIIRNSNELFFKGSPFPIGGKVYKKVKEFTSIEIDLQKGDRLFLYSDGYQDQFGGERTKKFMSKNFRALLQSTSANYTLEKQIQHLYEAHLTHKGSLEQTDDIMIIGIQI